MRQPTQYAAWEVSYCCASTSITVTQVRSAHLKTGGGGNKRTHTAQALYPPAADAVVVTTLNAKKNH